MRPDARTLVDDTRRLTELHAVTAELARPSLSVASIARVVVEDARAALGALSAALYVAERDGAMRVIASRGETVPPERLVALPLAANGVALGGITFGFARLDASHEQLARIVAVHASLAMERVKFEARARRAEERARTLADASRTLAETLECSLTIENIARIAVPDVADHTIAEVTLGDQSRRVHAGSEEAATWSSAFTAPLVVDGERVGSLMACFGRSGRRHDDDDVALLEELARRAGTALHNARLYAMAREAAEQAEETARRAEEASRLKDEFLATVSHELRTPLSSILGWATMLREEGSLASKGLEVIERNARSQQRIIEDMLDVSRIITGKLRVDTEPVDLCALSRDVAESARPAATAKEVSIDLDAEGACRLAGDGARLRQVLVNLVSNAVKFTPAGGRVRIHVEQIGDRVVVRVRDTGKGIAPEFLPFVFDRFRQEEAGGSREQGGLGLGLAIARHLVMMHAGSVEVTSDGVGRGAEFTVTLPVKPFSAPVGALTGVGRAARPAVPLERPQRLEGLHILVVEDEADSRDLIELLLETEGATVLCASTADAALDALDRFKADVVLSDIGMPGHDGYWLISELRSRRSNLPAIALTAYSSHVDVSRALEAGFDHHVGKPVDPEHLVAALLALCGSPTTGGPQRRASTAA